MWLSCSCFFYQYFRCYSPVAFPKKYDKNGDYVRHWLPQLAKLPAKVRLGVGVGVGVG